MKFRLNAVVTDHDEGLFWHMSVAGLVSGV